MYYKTSESFGKQTFFSCTEHRLTAKTFLYSLKKCNKTQKSSVLFIENVNSVGNRIDASSEINYSKSAYIVELRMTM